MNKEPHPLESVFKAALNQATQGKGTRHGGDSKPFYDQDWAQIAQSQGIGFLLGQAEKKLRECRNKPDIESAIAEILGAINYAAMAVLHAAGKPEDHAAALGVKPKKAAPQIVNQFNKGETPWHH